MNFTLGQRVRVSAVARVVYDETWWRTQDGYGRPQRFVHRENWAEEGWVCLHAPHSGSINERITKKLWHRQLDEPLEGVVIAKSWRATGWYSLANDDLGDPPFLAVDKRHTFYEIAYGLGINARLWAIPADMELI
jgi:hypothetical protein